MDRRAQQRRWFWATLILSCISIAAVVFAAWELVENHFFRDLDYLTLHYLYITRGIASSLLLALWAAWFVLRQRRQSEEELRLSREHYRGLLEASPGAVALYDASLRVSEWNATAERLYGFSKEEVIGQQLPTVPPGKAMELEDFLTAVRQGQSVLDVETLRRDKNGRDTEVQLSLLPFHEDSQQMLFLEVTTDVRERVRLRQTLLEIEKLTSMGKMAAGTAHHLNTPLAAMLLRVQMMRERPHPEAAESDLERLESGIRSCQHFVQRLLEFSRPTPVEKRPEDVARTIESVVSFLAPSLLVKHAEVSLELQPANGERVLADRNLLEVLFSILLSNALDAISPGGKITIRSVRPSPDEIDIEISDDGCGIPDSDLPHIFEPFFSTKPPGEGTGLGLAIARNIAHEHGGALRLESTPHHGTTARIALPVWQPARVAHGEPV